MDNAYFAVLSEDSDDIFLSCEKAKACISFSLQAKFIYIYIFFFSYMPKETVVSLHRSIK